MGVSLLYYTIYKVTNLLNGKFYIGKHQTKKLDDNYMGSGKLLIRAFHKYGIGNFHKEILYIFDVEWKMNLAEKILVIIDKELSYNLCPGGRGGWGYININKLGVINSQNLKIPNGIAARKRSSERFKKMHKEGKMNYVNKGWVHTKEYKQKISVIMKEKQKGELNSQFGTMWITNGIDNKKIKKTECIPFGFYRGKYVQHGSKHNLSLIENIPV